MPKGITGFHDDMLDFFSSMTYEELQNEFYNFMEEYDFLPIAYLNDNTDRKSDSELD